MSDNNFSFLDELDEVEGGESVKGYVPKKVDPVQSGRTSFNLYAKHLIAHIMSGFSTGKSYGTQRYPNGRVKLILRNGTKIMTLKGKSYFMLPDAESASKFLAKAILASEAGEFDEEYKRTAMKRRSAEGDEPTAADLVINQVRDELSRKRTQDAVEAIKATADQELATASEGAVAT